MKYFMTMEVDAEQFLAEAETHPDGVISDGPRSPKVDPRASWVIKTDDGLVYLKDKDYIITTPLGSKMVMAAERFEEVYKAAPEK